MGMRSETEFSISSTPRLKMTLDDPLPSQRHRRTGEATDMTNDGEWEETRLRQFAHRVSNPAAVVNANIGALAFKAERISSALTALRSALVDRFGSAGADVFDEQIAEHRVASQLGTVREICVDTENAAKQIGEAISALRSSKPPSSDPGPDARPDPAPMRVQASHRVLLVEDDPLLRRAMSRVLAPPHHVTTAANGREALELLAEGADFDVVLCDIAMPEVDGLTFLAETRKQFPSIAERIVFMSGGASSTDAEQLAHLPEAVVLDKPVSRETLLTTVTGVGTRKR